MSRADRQRKQTDAPEFVVDASNPLQIRIWARADVFAAIEDASNKSARRAAAELAIARISAQLRRRAA